MKDQGSLDSQYGISTDQPVEVNNYILLATFIRGVTRSSYPSCNFKINSLRQKKGGLTVHVFTPFIQPAGNASKKPACKNRSGKSRLTYINYYLIFFLPRCAAWQLQGLRFYFSTPFSSSYIQLSANLFFIQFVCLYFILYEIAKNTVWFAPTILV